VRDSNGTLLLAAGHLLPDAKSVQALIDRGMFIDAAEAAEVARKSSPEKLQVEGVPVLWKGLEAHLNSLLKSPSDPHFLPGIQDAAEQLADIARGNTDQLMFLMMRHDHSRHVDYGITHSLHTAAMCSLLTDRLGWPASQIQNTLGAALTMNISMLELQGQLAVYAAGPSEADRKIIENHPLASAEMLRTAGLKDQAWLDAVEQHHEIPGGSGYPKKLAQTSEISRLIRIVDMFSAKHSPRASRKAMPAQQAARSLFQQSSGDSMAGLLIKEFGIYPPGSFVKLASGETAVVTQRGASANSPVVVAITNKNGDPLSQPSKRDTTQAGHAVIDSVDKDQVKVYVTAEMFYSYKAKGPRPAAAVFDLGKKDGAKKA
jgi:HD-GYP domain-containing protein (c-di-GMP phosphodiesterase class II)